MKVKYFEFTMLTIGCVLYALAFILFFTPAQIVPGGFTGLSMIINHLTGFPIGLSVMILNLPLFSYATHKFGKIFMIRTIFCTVLSSIFIDIGNVLIDFKADVLLSSIFGGVLVGTGLGVIFNFTGTTGGTDILGKIIKGIKPHFSIGQLMLFIDFVIITLSVITFGDINVGLYGIISLYITTQAIDLIMEGSKAGRLIFIISQNKQKITDEILTKSSRGVTIVQAMGAYTHKENNILMCAVSRTELPQIRKLVEQIDNTSFMIVVNTYEVLGDGFNNF